MYVASNILSDKGMVSEVEYCVYPKNSDVKEKTTFIKFISHHLDPMVFPILFPAGDLGWSTGYTKNEKTKENLSTLQYYSYRLAFTPNSELIPFLYAGRLTQQYLIHAYIVVESNRMNYFRQNQNCLRRECYDGLYNAIFGSAANTLDEGKKYKSDYFPELNFNQ